MTTLRALPALLLSLVLLAAGCGPASEQGATGRDSAQTADAAAPADASACSAPLRVAVMQDKSGSANEHRTPQLAVGDLKPIIKRLRACGGELAVGLIKEESNRSLTRLYLARPDLKPLPEEPSREESDNVFAFDQAVMEYKNARAKAEKVRATTLARHHRTTEQRIEAFTAEAADLLKTAPEARHTDVWGGIRRAELFLAEPEVGAGAAPRKVMIVISDALDNRGRTPVTLPPESGAQVLLVNSAPSLGAFENQTPKPVQMESIPSAVRYLERRFGS